MSTLSTARFSIPAGGRDRVRYELTRTASHREGTEQHCDYRLEFVGDLGRVIVRQYRNGTLTVTGAPGDALAGKLSRIVRELSGAVVATGRKEAARGQARDCSGSERIGSDESGKGDYFGPLVAAAVYVNDRTEDALTRAGVRDSKQLSDAGAGEIATDIRRILGTDAIATVLIAPQRYNELYSQVTDSKGKPNLNELLAWAHSRAIRDLFGVHPCGLVVTDRFGGEHLMRRRLAGLSSDLEYLQFPRAESDTAVAAASIIARDRFLAGLNRLSTEIGFSLPKGAGPPVLLAGGELVKRFGPAILDRVAKLHFKTTMRLR